MLHIDLFSGIGGFALAVDEVWPGTEHIFCEIDPYCQALLKKRFKGARIYGDIRTLSRERLTADTYGNGLTRGSEEINTTETEPKTFGDVEERDVFILTGGFPCQPFSQAGKRKGTDDNRYLWPEMLRVIRDFKPTWVIAENVRGLLTIEQGMVFEQVCLDLEGEGYEVQAFVIPAVAVNAPHRRDRVWFVAHSSSSRRKQGNIKRETSEERNSTKHIKFNSESKICNAPDTDNGRHSISERLEGKPWRWSGKKHENRFKQGGSDWERNWLEVATELCGVDDGLPAELDGLKLSRSKHRVERLKALGNAIVPQVAVELLRAIKEGGK